MRVLLYTSYKHNNYDVYARVCVLIVCVVKMKINVDKKLFLPPPITSAMENSFQAMMVSV